jgi:uncharacterized membrane protein
MQNKQRHGCLTAWLIYMIIAYTIISVTYFFNTNKISEISPYRISENMLLIYGTLGIFNIGFCVLIFKWVRIGFWGILVTSSIVFVTQLINGHGFFQPVIGLLGIIVLYALLQIKKQNVSGWENLE